MVGGVTTIVTADRGSGINLCPSRITISGVLGNPSLNGVYNTTGCADSKTISVTTPGVPNWSYPNNTLPEPVIGLTSGTITSISGYSDLGGADSAVTLGLWLTAPNQDMSKRANVIAGTLFHEIGHTLGLSHGGLYYDTPSSYIPTFEANCKPNYQSVMNYLFQLDVVGPSQAVAFSNQTLITLNESAAGSVTQLTSTGSSGPATFPTSAWYVPSTTGSSASPATLHCDGTPLTGDSAYRVDASIAPITPPWSNGQDINFDGQLNTQMRGYNDLANIDLRQVGATGGEFASLASVLSFGSSAAPLNIGCGWKRGSGQRWHRCPGQRRNCDLGQWRQRHTGQRRHDHAGQWRKCDARQRRKCDARQWWRRNPGQQRHRHAGQRRQRNPGQRRHHHLGQRRKRSFGQRWHRHARQWRHHCPRQRRHSDDSSRRRLTPSTAMVGPSRWAVVAMSLSAVAETSPSAAAEL